MAAYAKAVAPIDKLIDEYKYDAALKESFLVTEYADRIAGKRERIQMLKATRQAVIDAFEKGQVKAEMGDVAPKWKYAGAISKVDGQYVYAMKGKFGKEWTEFGKDEIYQLYRRALPGNIVTTKDTKITKGQGGEERPAAKSTVKLKPGETPKGAVLYLSFDKKTIGYDKKNGQTIVKDLSGKGNHGIIHGAKLGKGVVKDALEFDGKDDYVDFGNRRDWSLAENSHSFSLWFRAESGDRGRYHRILGRFMRGDAGSGYVIYVMPSGGLYYEERGKAKLELKHGTVVADSRWHHVAVTVDANVRHSILYIDGGLSMERSYAGELHDCALPLLVGGSGRDNFCGVIDELMIFGRALSAEEVQALYAVGGGR